MDKFTLLAKKIYEDDDGSGHTSIESIAQILREAILPAVTVTSRESNATIDNWPRMRGFIVNRDDKFFCFTDSYEHVAEISDALIQKAGNISLVKPF